MRADRTADLEPMTIEGFTPSESDAAIGDEIWRVWALIQEAREAMTP
jgi:hypothetical protein